MSKNVVCICAHPDDETLGCGGTIARHVAEGDNVSVLWMTDGVGSRFSENELRSPEHNKAVDDRNNAARRAMDILGVKYHKRLFDRSSGMDYAFEDQALDRAGVTACAKAIESTIGYAAEIIYTHHLGDLNADHRITAQAVLTAFRPVPGSSVEAIYSFEVPSSTEWGLEAFVPDTFVNINGGPSLKKREALHAYEMEMREFPHPRSIGAINAFELVRGSQAGLYCAEAFKTLRRVVH